MDTPDPSTIVPFPQAVAIFTRIGERLAATYETPQYSRVPRSPNIIQTRHLFTYADRVMGWRATLDYLEGSSYCTIEMGTDRAFAVDQVAAWQFYLADEPDAFIRYPFSVHQAEPHFKVDASRLRKVDNLFDGFLYKCALAVDKEGSNMLAHWLKTGQPMYYETWDDVAPDMIPYSPRTPYPREGGWSHDGPPE